MRGRYLVTTYVEVHRAQRACPSHHRKTPLGQWRLVVPCPLAPSTRRDDHRCRRSLGDPGDPRGSNRSKALLLGSTSIVHGRATQAGRSSPRTPMAPRTPRPDCRQLGWLPIWLHHGATGKPITAPEQPRQPEHQRLPLDSWPGLPASYRTGSRWMGGFGE